MIIVMLDHRRSGYMLRWVCTLLFLAVATVFAISMRWQVERDIYSGGRWIGTLRGALIYGWRPPYLAPAFTRIEEFGPDAPVEWWPSGKWSTDRGGPFGYIIVPLWIPLSLTALATAFVWYRRFRSRAPGHCRHCGYNLTANQSGKCPECGNPAPQYDELSDKLERLIQSLILVAAPFEVQVASMPSFVCVPDEIALTLGDGCQFIPELRESGRIDEHQAEGLRQIDKFFAKMSGRANADWWSLDRMKDDEHWAESRRMAAEVLGRFGRKLAKPDLYWIKFVPGS